MGTPSALDFFNIQRADMQIGAINYSFSCTSYVFCFHYENQCRAEDPVFALSAGEGLQQNRVLGTALPAPPSVATTLHLTLEYF